MVKIRLRILLAEHQISQKELAEATGIRQATISAYCSGVCKHIVKKHIDIICTFFNCEVSDFIEYTKDNSKD